MAQPQLQAGVGRSGRAERGGASKALQLKPSGGLFGGNRNCRQGVGRRRESVCSGDCQSGFTETGEGRLRREDYERADRRQEMAR